MVRPQNDPESATPHASLLADFFELGWRRPCKKSNPDFDASQLCERFFTAGISFATPACLGAGREFQVSRPDQARFQAGKNLPQRHRGTEKRNLTNLKRKSKSGKRKWILSHRFSQINTDQKKPKPDQFKAEVEKRKAETGKAVGFRREPKSKTWNRTGSQRKPSTCNLQLESQMNRQDAKAPRTTGGRKFNEECRKAKRVARGIWNLNPATCNPDEPPRVDPLFFIGI